MIPQRSFQVIRMDDRTSKPLPDRWKDIQADHLYSSAEPYLLSFSVTQTVAAIDPSTIAHHHIQACQSQIRGYWDEDDQFHDTIRFTQPIIPELVSSSLGITPDLSGDTPWLKFRYMLTVSDCTTSIGELNLILNDSLEVIDENWLIDLHSPYVLSV